jgi:hypothetical protein
VPTEEHQTGKVAGEADHTQLGFSKIRLFFRRKPQGVELRKLSGMVARIQTVLSQLVKQGLLLCWGEVEEARDLSLSIG